MAGVDDLPMPQTGMQALLGSAGATGNILNSIMQNRRANQLMQPQLQQYADLHQQHQLANQLAQQKYHALQQYLSQFGMGGAQPQNQGVPIVKQSPVNTANMSLAPQNAEKVLDQAAPSYSQPIPMNAAPLNLTHMATVGPGGAPPVITSAQAPAHGINVPKGYVGELTYQFTPQDNMGMAVNALQSGKIPTPTYKMDQQGNTQIIMPGKGIYTLRRDPNVVASEKGNIAESEETGKEHAKRIGEMQQEVTASAPMGDALDQYDNIFSNQGYQKIANQQFFRGKTLGWIKDHATEDQKDIQKAVTDLESLGSQITSNKAKLFKGPFRQFEFGLVNSLIPTKDDSFSAALEKYRLLKTFYETGKMRQLKMLQLMRGPQHLSEDEAFKQANDDSKMSGLKEDINKKIQGIERKAGADRFMDKNPWPKGATKLVYNHNTKKYQYLYS